MKLEDALGHAPEELSLPLRESLTGYWVALELYDPHRLPLRKILAIADKPATCLAQLEAKGLDLSHYEVVRLPAAH
jgi:hypothetical protein